MIIGLWKEVIPIEKQNVLRIRRNSLSGLGGGCTSNVSTSLWFHIYIFHYFFSFFRAYLVPVFSFGENEIYNQVDNPRGSRLRAFQNKLMKILSFAPPLFFGRGISRILPTFLPYKRPICTVGKCELLISLTKHKDS